MSDPQALHDARLRRQDVATLHSARRSYKGARPGVDPAVARLGELLRPHAGDIEAIAKRAGVDRSTIRRWFADRRPARVANLRAVLNVIGYDLTVVKITKPKGETP